MFDKREVKRVRLYEFPRSRFIDYEKSDLRWAKFGYAKLLIDRVDIIQNNVVQSQHLSESINGVEDGQIVSETTILNTSIVRNPNSTWKPVWNPLLIG